MQQNKAGFTSKGVELHSSQGAAGLTREAQSCNSHNDLDTPGQVYIDPVKECQFLLQKDKAIRCMISLKLWDTNIHTTENQQVASRYSKYIHPDCEAIKASLKSRQDYSRYNVHTWPVLELDLAIMEVNI